VDECFHDFYRSRKHYVPDPEIDIKLLIARHMEMGIHHHLPNRPENQKEERTLDCWAEGHKKLAKGYLDSLARDRAQYFAYKSSLELASHQNQSIEEIIEQIKKDSQSRVATGPDTQQWRERLEEMDGNGNGNELDDDEMAYGYDQQNNVEVDDEYRRMRLTNAWSH
jgi:hypothetical protein